MGAVFCCCCCCCGCCCCCRFGAVFVCLPVLAVFQNPQSITRIVTHRCPSSLMHTKQAPAASISTRGPFPPVSCFPMASSPRSVVGPGHLVAKFFSITFAYSPSSLSLLPIQCIVLVGIAWRFRRHCPVCLTPSSARVHHRLSRPRGPR